MGYVLIYHSQGSPAPGMTKAIKQEWDTRQCTHCGGIVRIPVKRRLIGEQGDVVDRGHFCLQCMGPVCVRCVKQYGTACVPFMQALLQRAAEHEAQRKLNDALA